MHEQLPLSEQEQCIDNQDPALSRRGLFRMAAFGASALAYEIARGEAETADLTSGYLDIDIPPAYSTLPAEVTEYNPAIHNPNFQPHSYRLLQDALAAFQREGGQPFFRPPKPPLTMASLVGHNALPFLRSIRRYDDWSGFGVPDFEPVLPDSFIKLQNFSAFDNDSLETLYSSDIGSTGLERANAGLESLGIRGGIATVSESDSRYLSAVDLVGKAYASVFDETETALRSMHRGPVSTAELFKHYLHQCDGDIVRSLIDTTLFLKMACRTNLDALRQPLSPSRLDLISEGQTSNKPLIRNIAVAGRQQADLVAGLFVDDFSRQLPLASLIRSIPANAGLDDINPFTESKAATLKDFDVVNRAGTPYHVWNIMLLSAYADPAVVRTMVSEYYSNSNFSSASLNHHGAIKADADRRAARSAGAVTSILNTYNTSSSTRNAIR